MNVNAFSNTPPERDVALLQALGALQFAFGCNDTALNLLELARFLDARNRDTQVMLARIYYAEHALDAALACMDYARAISPEALSDRDEIFDRRLRLLAEVAQAPRMSGSG